MIVLSRSKKAAVFTASLTVTPWSPPPRGAYAPLDIRLMDPYVRRKLPVSGSFCVPPPPPPCPVAHAPKRAHAEERRGAAVLLALWSPKGGSGTSVLAAACALVLGRRGGARLADLDGDQPALFGLASEPPTGLVDWLGAGPEAPTDALERLTVEAASGVSLIPRGTPARPLAPVPATETGAALAVALRDGLVPTVVDLGLAQTPAARAVLEVADASLVVVRGCYLTLRRAVRAAPLAHASGVVHVAEPGRAIGRRDVAGVLDRPVLAEVPVRTAIARAVDAGLLPTRLPEVLARPVHEALGRLGLLGERRGQA